MLSSSIPTYNLNSFMLQGWTEKKLNICKQGCAKAAHFCGTGGLIVLQSVHDFNNDNRIYAQKMHTGPRHISPGSKQDQRNRYLTFPKVMLALWSRTC